MTAVVFVDEDRCTGCGNCVDVCPHDAIYLEDGIAHLVASRCAGCEACLESCPEGALYAVTESAAEPEASQVVTQDDQVDRPMQRPSALVTAIGAAIMVAQRVLPAVASLVGALQSDSTEVVQQSQVRPSSPASGAGGHHGRHRARKGRGPQA